MTRSFRIDVDVPQPPEKVWRALTEPPLMGLWLMNFDQTEGEAKVDFQPRLGAAWRLDAPAKGWRGYVVGTVLAVEPKARLAYTWAHGKFQDRHPTRIEYTLAPTPAGTRLRMEQSGFPGLKGWFVLKMAKLGWGKMLKEGLPKVAAKA